MWHSLRSFLLSSGDTGCNLSEWALARQQSSSEIFRINFNAKHISYRSFKSGKDIIIIHAPRAQSTQLRDMAKRKGTRNEKKKLIYHPSNNSNGSNHRGSRTGKTASSYRAGYHHTVRRRCQAQEKRRNTRRRGQKARKKLKRGDTVCV